MDSALHEIHQYPVPYLPVFFPLRNRNGTDPQWHRDIELLYCTAGKGRLVCGGTEHTMEPGHIYVINSNELHSTFDRGGLYYYCLIVDEEFLSQSGLDTQRAEIETVVCDSQANSYYDEIIRQMETREHYYVPKVRGLLLLLIAQLLEQHQKRPHGQSPRLQDPDAPIKLAVDFIKANYSRKLTLEEVAAVAGFSKQYFANRFRKSIGMTVVEYINLVRCIKAEKLLRQKNMSIQQIANRCGFENTSYFSKTFQKVMGMLPSEMRRKGVI